MDTTVPHYTRFKWPKNAPALDDEQLRISNDFMHHWREVLPQRYGALEQFNHGYPLRFLPAASSEHRSLSPISSPPPRTCCPAPSVKTARELSWGRDFVQTFLNDAQVA
jgi:hypothetical protein